MPRSKNRPLIFIACAAIVALMVAGAGSAAAYGILFPAFWTERLPFVNSTGQFETVIHYRNATDDTYENVTRFIASVSAGLEADVADDPTYRCVEYAVQLHDEALEAGTRLRGHRDGDGPGHARTCPRRLRDNR